MQYCVHAKGENLLIEIYVLQNLHTLFYVGFDRQLAFAL